MELDQQPFFDAFGEEITVNGVPVQAIVKEEIDEAAKEYGHIEHQITLEVMAVDRSLFIEGAVVVTNNQTLTVFKEPITRMDGILEVHLGL